MKLLITGNCTCEGLAIFLRKALPHWEIHHLPHLGTFFGEITEETILKEHAWAELVFYQTKQDNPQNYPTKAPKIPLSVWYQSAPFMAWVPQNLWEEFKDDNQLFSPNDSNGLIEYLVKDHDFDYEARWNECWDRMKVKEIDEGVPEDIRISYLMQWGRQHQLQLTHNHPTSLVFLHWSDRILEYLGEKKWSGYTLQDCIMNPNIAGLPCEESATSGARKHLGLAWGGRPEDDESGRQIARKMLA